MAEEKREDIPPSSPDVHFEPVVRLNPVETKTMEEDEEEIFAMRAKLFRYANELEPAEWKERGTGDLKILRHRKDFRKLRVLMRRDKTLKVCANHYITSQMELVPNCGSDRAWVWSVLADFADEEPKAETLAIRFANAENAQKFKAKFDECQQALLEKELEATKSSKEEADQVADKLGEMSVKDEKKTEETSKDSEEKKEEKKEDAKDDSKEKKEDSKEETKDSTEEKKQDSS
ncbi:ran-specific GTPase-activating protein-like isoform X2 [Ptychodera flava]|uniref:ran-specific GTPase-activating protein-like isoform X2 n=1 Tax=Ptychodera flava TaxID=63121 RepID=UPI003969DB4C